MTEYFRDDLDLIRYLLFTVMYMLMLSFNSITVSDSVLCFITWHGRDASQSIVGLI
jgi:hypothetical protein